MRARRHAAGGAPWAVGAEWRHLDALGSLADASLALHVARAVAVARLNHWGIAAEAAAALGHEAEAGVTDGPRAAGVARAGADVLLHRARALVLGRLAELLAVALALATTRASLLIHVAVSVGGKAALGGRPLPCGQSEGGTDGGERGAPAAGGAEHLSQAIEASRVHALLRKPCAYHIDGDRLSGSRSPSSVVPESRRQSTPTADKRGFGNTL
jgi:hypothetical protein